jgi:uncharacterized protein YrrD
VVTNQQLAGLAVVSIDTGEKLGVIDQVAVDTTGRRIVAFTVQSGSGGLFTSPTVDASWLPANQVHAVGPDAVTVPSPKCLKDHIEQADLLLASDLMKRKIVTEGGVYLGDVAALHLDTQAMTVTQLEVSHGLLKTSSTVSIEHLITIGHELIIAASGAEDQSDDAPMLDGGVLSELEAGPSKETVVGDVGADQRGGYRVVPQMTHQTEPDQRS